MRKSKNIILPTKCLNQMGFLLLFLSCPVIGDWGRIRPDTEMSQWSIIVEKEGTCGLVRDPPGINDKFSLDGSAEHGNMLETGNDVLPKADDSSPSRETGHELALSRGIDVRRMRWQSERRMSRERSEERSARDSRNTIRYGREVGGETREGRRLAPETLRRLSRKAGNERVRDAAERGFDARRGTPESVARNENARSRRVARERMERRRIDGMTRNSRSERRETERMERRDSRSVAREERDERKPEDRRSREIIQTRRFDMSERRDGEERQRRSERRVSNERERTDWGLRIDDRRQDRKIRAERSAEGRRVEVVRSRRQDGFRRLEKAQREVLDRCNNLEPFTLKQKKPEESRVGEFFSGIKNWFKQKTAESSWVGKQGDFATTCLVGAAAYFLTTHHNKSN